jgi:hypothetical protein
VAIRDGRLASHLLNEAWLSPDGGSGLEKKLQSFPQIISSGLDGVALACDIQFRAQGNIAIALALDQSRQFY